MLPQVQQQLELFHLDGKLYRYVCVCVCVCLSVSGRYICRECRCFALRETESLFEMGSDGSFALM
jgi:hypothetical protein